MMECGDVAYCGLYCGLCSTKTRLPEQAAALRKTLAQDGWEYYGEYVVPGFGAFWEGLGKMIAFGENCPGCRGGCGDPDCGIRKCAVERGVELCPLCAEFPCGHIDALARRYPNLIADGMRLAEIGTEAWLLEQKERRATGYCYCDTRFPARPGGSSL